MLTTSLPDFPPPNTDPITADVLRAAIHDLKGPSGRLRVLAELVNRSSSVDDDTRALMMHIKDTARSMDAVIDALRSYSEICAQPLHKESLDLALPLAAAIGNRANEIAAAGVDVVYRALPVVSVDGGRMAWLFEELLVNAMHFRGDTLLRIHITADFAGDSGWLIRILDNGPGIEPALVERVFRPFKKGSGASGAGLGLTICRKIAEMHGGRMWAEPRTGGADIRIQLPA